VKVTHALKLGTNALEIRVVNFLVNRLIADSALPLEKHLTWATWSPYTPADTSLTSGLPGPAKLVAQTNE
jgi:hypothetical protein